MPGYRIYRVDEEGHITGLAAEITCDTDDQAIERSRQYVDGLAVEVWNRARLVKRLEPDEVNAPAVLRLSNARLD